MHIFLKEKFESIIRRTCARTYIYMNKYVLRVTDTYPNTKLHEMVYHALLNVLYYVFWNM